MTSERPAGAPATAELQIGIERLRSDHGIVRACLTRNRAFFPNCKSDPDALKASTPAPQAHRFTFRDIPVGAYALSVIHDENGNGRLDTFAKVPTEGFGFSRNPPIRFGPPAFKDVRFAVSEGENRQSVRIRYLL